MAQYCCVGDGTPSRARRFSSGDTHALSVSPAARFDLLAHLYREDGQTLAALSRRMRVTAGNLTGLVDRAERDGVVERRADPRDRRLSRAFLTPKGRDLVQALIPAHAAHVSELLSLLEAGERRDLRRLLGRLRESLVARSVRRAAPAQARPRKDPSEKR